MNQGWQVKIVTPTAKAVMEVPDIEADAKGFIDPLLLDGATVYAAGAVSPLSGCREVVAVPTPAWKGRQ